MADTMELFLPRNAPVIFNSVASLTFIIWNWLLTLDEEVAYVWSQCGRLSWIHWVYFFNRYAAIFAQSALFYQRVIFKPDIFSISGCHAWFSLRVLAPPIFVISIQTILIARVRALYHRNVVFVRIVYCVFILEAAMIFCGALVLAQLIELNAFCFPRYPDKTKRAYVLLNTPPFLFEAAFFALTFYKAVRLSHDVGGTRYAPLLQQVLKDGTWAFLLLCITFFANHLTILIAAGPDMFTLINWLVPVISFTSSRLILNMLEFEPAAHADRVHHLYNSGPSGAGYTRESVDRAPMTTHVELEMGALTRAYANPTSTVTWNGRMSKAC